MNEAPDPRESAAAKAESELARLNGRVATMRAVLVQLLQDVVQAERQLNSSQAARLLEANEQLVIAALGAQTDAQTAAGALDEANRSSGLDPLTGLPNRVVLLDRLEQALSNARRHGNRVAVLFLDLNNFKLINDSFGHAVGDQALQLVADCMTSLVRETDTVSRHGGDEFLIVLAEISHAADASIIAGKVNAALRGYSRIDEHAVRLTASIGISIYPEDGEDAKTLIERCDAAMYRAKKNPLGGFAFHVDQPADQPSLPAPSVQQRRLTHHELTMAEHERRHAQLQEANEQLVLAALGAQELLAAAEETRRRRSELLGAVVQELRDPFAPIRIAAGMLGRPGAHEVLLPRAQAIVAQQMDRLSQMVAGVLEPVKLEESVTLEHRLFDVRAVATEVVRACRPAIDARFQTLALQVPSTPVGVNGDPIQIARVLTNLLDNATTYTRNGGQIGLSIEVVGDAVVMTLSDNGMGIAPDALATLLHPFVRDPRASGVGREGLGFGLTIVRAVVEAHGGSIVAASGGVGLGSQFTVSLPAGSNPKGPGAELSARSFA